MSILSFAASAVFHPAFIEVVSIFVVALIVSFIYKADNHTSGSSASWPDGHYSGEYSSATNLGANGEACSMKPGAAGQQTTHQAAFANATRVTVPPGASYHADSD